MARWLRRSSRQTQLKNDNSPPTAASSADELGGPQNPKKTGKSDANEEEVRDSIVVSADKQSAKSSNDKVGRYGVTETTPPTPTPKKRLSEASPNESAGSPRKPGSRRGTPIKKQEFEVIAPADDGEEDELSVQEPTPKKVKIVSRVAKVATFRKGRSKWDNPDEMLTNPKAPLVNANLRDMLLSNKAWEILTPEEKQKVLSKFPDDLEILDPNTAGARPDFAALRNNDNFRHDVARYQEGLRQGFHDPEWIQQAQAAHRKRELGMYDEFMAADFQERWGLSMRVQQEDENMKDRSGDLENAPAPNDRKPETPEKSVETSNKPQVSTTTESEPASHHIEVTTKSQEKAIPRVPREVEDSPSKDSKKTETLTVDHKPTITDSSTSQSITVPGGHQDKKNETDITATALRTEIPNSQSDDESIENYEPDAKAEAPKTNGDTEVKSEIPDAPHDKPQSEDKQLEAAHGESIPTRAEVHTEEGKAKLEQGQPSESTSG
ncbi:Asx homology domain-containing protein [Xylariaceae sp. FL0255]|nr:Asx homology domain-containing protein [Xylariaceae sp. FL0255]